MVGGRLGFAMGRGGVLVGGVVIVILVFVFGWCGAARQNTDENPGPGEHDDQPTRYQAA